MIVMNCDLLIHGIVFQRVLDTQTSSFAYDSSTGTDGEHMKVIIREDKLVCMSKDMLAKDSSGENVGVLFFDAETTRALFNELDLVLAEGGYMRWLATAVERVAKYRRLRGVDVADLPWIEIDYPEDLAQARRLIWPRLNIWPTAACA